MRLLLGESSVEVCPSLPAEARLALWTPSGQAVDGVHYTAAPGVAVTFSGYLDPLPAGHRGEADFVLARYQAADWTWLREASGVFSFAIVDHGRGRAVLATDRLGIRPLFFAHDGIGTAFASDLSALAPWQPRPPEIDHDALQEQMALGFPLGSRTLWRHVERMPPGSRLEMGPGLRHLHRYWSLEDLPAVTAPDPDRFLDESQERLRRALARTLERSRGEALCLLSSGYDSRRLLLEAHALGARLDTVTASWTFPGRPGTSLEPAVARELCGALAVPNRLVTLPGSGDSRALDADRRARDVLLAYQVKRDHVWAIPLVAALPASAVRPNLDGMAGDTFFNNPFYFLPRSVWGHWRPEREVLEAIAPGHERLDRWWGGLISSSLGSRIRSALEAVPEGPYRLPHFYLLGRTHRIVSLLPFGLLDRRVESVCPYLDRDVMEHAHTLDPLLKSELQLQKRALDRHHPRFRHLPSSHSSPGEVPPAYLTPMDVADAEPAFTAADLWQAVLPALAARRPRMERNDLAFVALSATGLDLKMAAWREPRVRDFLYAARARDAMGWPTSRWRRAQAKALDWLSGSRL
jgi:hypothetical protein